MSHVMYILNNAVQISILLFFMCNLRKPKFNMILLGISTLSIHSSIYILCTFCFKWPLENPAFNVLRNVPLILAFIIGFEGKTLEKVKLYIETALLFIFASVIGTPIMLNIFNSTYKELHFANSQQNVGMIGWSDIALTMAFIVCVYRSRKDDFFKRNKRNLITIICFPILHLIFMYMYFSNISINLDFRTVFIHSIYQAMVTFLLIFQYFGMKRSHELIKSEEQLKILQYEITHTQNYCALAESKFSEISILRHDINNQISTIKNLITVEGDNIKAHKMIEELQTKLMKMQSAKYCSNPIINAVLVPKVHDALEENINCQINLLDSDNLPFDYYDICSLFANLFDNAVEACENIDSSENRYIELRTKINGEFYVISITNSCNSNLSVQKTNHLKSTKNGKGHGYGMEIINNIVKKYYGDININCEKNEFNIIIALKI